MLTVLASIGGNLPHQIYNIRLAVGGISIAVVALSGHVSTPQKDSRGFQVTKLADGASLMWLTTTPKKTPKNPKSSPT